jgi:hypothetical protein
MKSVLRIRIYVVRIRNTGTGTNINTNEISAADPDLCGADPQHRYRY